VNMIPPVSRDDARPDRTIGQRLQTLRHRGNLTQEDLAERSGLSVRTIRGFERGETRLPHPANRQRLTEALGLDDVSSQWLFAPDDAVTSTAFPDLDDPIIGRDADLASLLGLLQRRTARLITLTGPGGVGKTRLARAVAARESIRSGNPVTLVSLAELADPGDLIPAIAAALGLVNRDGDLRDHLVRRLGNNTALLLLDNLEHLLDAAPRIAWLLAACPDLVVLATSREALRISGEHLHAVAPLPAETPGDPAAELFLRSAALAGPGVLESPGAEDRDAILALCQRLGGLPLAIELAAAQMDLLTPTQLLSLFDRSGLDALAPGNRDGPGRFASMAAAIDWSWQRLADDDQRLMRLAAIFAGGFTADAAGAVFSEVHGLPAGEATAIAAAAIPRLLRKNLLRLQPPLPSDDAPRFTMLEPIRLHALQRLAGAGEEATGRLAHASWIAERCMALDLAMTGPRPDAWIDRLERDYPNARLAIDYAIEIGDAAILERIITPVVLLWQYRDHSTEAISRVDRTLAMPGLEPVTEAMACFVAGELAFRIGRVDRVREVSGRLIELARDIPWPLGLGVGLLHLSMIEPDPDAAAALVREAQAAVPPEIEWRRPFFHGWAQLRLGIELHHAGDLEAARIARERAADLRRGSPAHIALPGAPGHLGLVLNDLGQPRAAAAAIAADIPVALDLGDHWTVYHLARWLVAVALPHAASDPAIAPICANLLAALDTDRALRGYVLSESDLAFVDTALHGVALPDPDTLDLDLALADAADLSALLPCSAPIRSPGRLTVQALA
jgi:predicted ATPase